DRVMLYPPQTQPRLADFYSAADVVLVPSRSESFGLVALEAQACGTPVIAANVGGLRYVVQDGVGGFLVEGHDPGDHAERLIQILRSDELRSELGERGAHEALRFTWDATAGELHTVYRELLDARV
ncbi:MAG: D-inositol-3-phosphate glycosyltransferase, partial [Actinomycetota bacterium]|nr:D-inositol-3-phosphate glycosyltransferase [Actinomycetota bacterium]